MRRVLIGIHTYAEPARLRATLESLRANTPGAHELLLLGDGPDEPTARALSRLKDVAQSNTSEAAGAPACFNRLVAARAADLYVLLESGAQVGPGWLDLLLASLDSDARNGLAGPSTDRCWNEQGLSLRVGPTPSEVDRAARALARRFGTETRTLGPLHSLADFCYAVRREVFEAVGAADEAYGLGPCWEMDYNVRAARAGFRGVWACGAYVQRAPLTRRRAREESLRFAASKSLYQDKFCGARLRGEKDDYRPHCRGDACPNFAPPDLIQIRLPPPSSTTLLSLTSTAALRNDDTSAPTSSATVTRTDAPRVRRASSDPSARPPDGPAITTRDASRAAHDPNPAARVPAPAASLSPQVSAPLVSCIMPTRDRRDFVPRAIRYFMRQDYPNLELLVVDDGEDSVADLLPDDPRVRHVRLRERLTVGGKRNLACGRARGEIIAHWDDDDWYPPWRVGRQVRALAESGAEVCGTSRLFYVEAATGRAWCYRYAHPRRAWVAGNTLAYRRRFWERHRFQDIQVGEDTRFVWGAPARAVFDLDEPALCVGLVHASNTSRKQVEGSYWHAEPVETVLALLGDDARFYKHAAPPAPSASPSSPSPSPAAYPLVSCIMPTFNRRPFVPLALESFLRQSYPNRELVVVDDGADAVQDLVRDAPGVRYVGVSRRRSIGWKRNLACREARGEIIAHWDDDDWYAPERLRYQVEPILAGEADITGLVSSFVMESPGGEFWTALPGLHASMFVGDVHGGTIVYRRSILEGGVRYPESNLAEDAALLSQAVRRGGRLLRLDNSGVFVYVRHGTNAWREFAPGSFIDPEGWERVAPPPDFTADARAAYLAAARLLQIQ